MWWQNLQRFSDAPQAAMSFLIQQLSIIEPQVYRIRYPEVQYRELVPVDTTGNEWAKSITFFSMDEAGRADWFHHMAADIPYADVIREKHEQQIEMAGIGYTYTMEELGQAMSQPPFNITVERASAARRAYERFVDDVALRGDSRKGWEGLINISSGITAGDATADGGSGANSPYWTIKAATENQHLLVMRDFNEVLTGIYTGTSQIEMADTVLLPTTAFLILSQTQIPNTTMTLFDWIMQKNVYTLRTGRPLLIRDVIGLETAGAAGTGRMIAYRRDPDVLKMHIPMPHRFLPVWQRAPIRFDVPGIFRLGGLEIRRPAAFRYLDHITPAP